MSVRAYKIITKEIADTPSFNLWHHPSLLDFLQNTGEYSDARNEDGVGVISVSVSAIEKSLKNKKLWLAEDLKGDEADIIKEALREDIKGHEGDDCYWLEYECY